MMYRRGQLNNFEDRTTENGAATHVRLAGGFAYLKTIKDWHTLFVLNWRLSVSIRSLYRPRMIITSSVDLLAHLG